MDGLMSRGFAGRHTKQRGCQQSDTSPMCTFLQPDTVNETGTNNNSNHPPPPHPEGPLEERSFTVTRLISQLEETNGKRRANVFSFDMPVI